MERRSLFNTRRKLFSEEVNEGGMMLRTVICQDCGNEFEIAGSPTHALCPKCGSKRFNLKMFYEKADTGEISDGKTKRFSLFGEGVEESFQRTFSKPSNEFEEKLKKYSGRSISKDEFEKVFSDCSNDLLEKGFANVDSDQVNISSFAYATERMFSKLIVSVTKVLDLDPETIGTPKEEIIKHLEEQDKIPHKGIIILKKAHAIPEEMHFSEEEPEDWVEDSSIIPDLKTEYANQSFGIKQFMDILRERYPDAPDNIIDLLTSRDVIRIEGSQVTVNI